MTDLDETRLKQATDALYDGGYFTPSEVENFARRAVEAYLADPKPKWPTDESLTALEHSANWNEHDRDDLRAAFLADPVIKAAVAYARCFGDGNRALYGCELRDAVKDAGLLDG